MNEPLCAPVEYWAEKHRNAPKISEKDIPFMKRKEGENFPLTARVLFNKEYGHNTFLGMVYKSYILLVDKFGGLYFCKDEFCLDHKILYAKVGDIITINAYIIGQREYKGSIQNIIHTSGDLL